MPIFKLGLLISVALMLGACMTQPKPSDPVQPREFRLSDVAKSDVDMAAEVAVKQWRSYLREIAEKLYLRNPNQLRRSDQPTFTAQQAAARLIKADGDLPQIKTTKSSDKVSLAFDPLFTAIGLLLLWVVYMACIKLLTGMMVSSSCIMNLIHKNCIT